MTAERCYPAQLRKPEDRARSWQRLAATIAS